MKRGKIIFNIELIKKKMKNKLTKFSKYKNTSSSKSKKIAKIKIR